MPELPEVEAARRAVQEHCSGRLITRASVAEDSKVIEGIEPFTMQQKLLGKRIVAAHRKGKQMWMELDERPWPCFQFGMTGAIYIKGVQVTKYVRSAIKDDEEWPSKFSKVFLELDNGLEMSFTDKRRLARVRLLDDPACSPPVSELGPDAFLELPNEDDFYSILTKKKLPVKALLLDQSIISGIGNWIADEVLYQARVHPEQPASSVSFEECKCLLESIKEVVKLAVEVDADSERFPRDWIFHYRWGKKPGSVNGKKIDFITVGGRTSAYVPALQKCSVAIENAKKPARKSSSKKKAAEDENDVLFSADDPQTSKPHVAGAKARSKAASRRKVAKEEVSPSQLETGLNLERSKKHLLNLGTEQKTAGPKKRGKPTKSAVLTKSEKTTKNGTDEGGGALNDAASDNAVAVFPFEVYRSVGQNIQKPSATLYSLWPSFAAKVSTNFGTFNGRPNISFIHRELNRDHPLSVGHISGCESLKCSQNLFGKLHVKSPEQFPFGAKVFSYILRRSASFF